MNNAKDLNWVIFGDADSLAQSAHERITKLAQHAIRLRGTFRIVLAGGTTPLAIYVLLSESRQDWAHWEVFWGDERCLPADHAQRNSQQANAAWLSRIAIPRKQIYPIPAELGPVDGASMYRAIIENAPPFDLVLLGLGEDGHTASLFPGGLYPQDARVIAVKDAPKPPPERVSLTPLALANCRNLMFLVTGKQKTAAVTQWRNGFSLPAADIEVRGEGEVLLDQDACPSGL